MEVLSIARKIISARLQNVIEIEEFFLNCCRFVAKPLFPVKNISETLDNMKRIVFTTVLAGLLGSFLYAQNNSDNTNHITSVKAVSTVCGQGKTLSTVILQYDAAIRNKSLSNSSYKVEEGEIVKVYSNTSAETAPVGKDGPFVVIELKAETDLDATPRKSHVETAEEKAERDRRQGGPGLKAGWSTGGNDIYPGSATVIQTADIKTAKGKTYKAFTDPLTSTEESCPLVDSFTQEEFVSPFTGQVLPYNLYLPDDFDPSVRYPLVLFIHDAGAVGTDVKKTLMQGRGAVTWADPVNQARNKCIVAAPQYPVVTVDDVWNYSHHLDATIELLKDLQKRYPVIYYLHGGTGNQREATWMVRRIRSQGFSPTLYKKSIGEKYNEE